MKKIMIYAYTKDNLGDDLFIKVLCDRYPDIKFILQTDQKNKFDDVKNLKCYKTEFISIKIINKVLRIIKLDRIQIPNIKEHLLLKKVDASVYIGGSIFMESENWKNQISLLNKRIDKSKKFYIMGCNFGPYSSEKFYEEYRCLLKKCKDICFRDEYSYNLFRDMNNVRKSDDIVFTMKNFEKNDNASKVTVSVIDLKGRKTLENYNNDYIDKMAELCKYMVDRGEEVNLISFCKAEGDERAIENILNRLDISYLCKINKIYYSGNIKDTLKILENSKCVISTRFHSMILGFILGVPTFPIIYSEKMKNVLDDIGFKGKFINIEDIKTLNIDNTYNNMYYNSIDVQKQKLKAEKQFKMLDILLDR